MSDAELVACRTALVMAETEIAELKARLEAIKRKCPKPDEHGDIDISVMMTFCEKVVAIAAAQQEKEDE